MKPKYQIIQGDCLEILHDLPKAKMVFADPPDNLGVDYVGYDDNTPRYYNWLYNLTFDAVVQSEIAWISFHSMHNLSFMSGLGYFQRDYKTKLFIWRFSFGQHRQNDCGNGYRPIIRIMRLGAKIYPNAIREPSARLKKYKDKRANPDGRIPDDVWEFPRVCGTFKERRKWFPNQHPEALMERIVKLSCKKGDTVIDMFGGSGTTLRVCLKLGIGCTLIEISPFYCQKISEETGVKVTKQ